MANVNRILIKSKSSAAGAPSTSDIQVGELAVNTVTGLTYLGTNSSNTGLGAGGTPTEISTIGMPVDSSDSLGASDVKLATQGAIKTYVDTATAANRDIDALDALSSVGNIHQTNDHFLISDAGTEKKITFSDLEDEIFGNVSTDVTIAAGGAASIADNAVGADELNVSGDGTSSQFLRSDGDGTFTWATPSTGTATAMTVADESSDTTCFPLFVTAATGDLAPKSGSNLTFNSSSGLLTASSFAGDITGDVTGNADTSTKIASITNSNIVQLTSSQTLTNKTLTSPTLTTPALGTPSALVLTNATALPAAQVAQGTMASGMVLVAPALGTPASGNLANCTFPTANVNTDVNVSVANLKTALASDLGGSATIGDANDTITFGEDVIVTGDLTVSGDTVTVNTATLSVEDPLIYMAKNQTGSASVDIGLIGERGDDTNVGIIFDESANVWSAITTADTGTTAGNVSISDYADFRAGTITSDDGFAGDLTGDVTGNADTSTKIASITNSNIVQLTTSQTLTNKSIDLGDNTISGSVAEFNTALQSDSFCTLANTVTLTNKTLTAPTLTTPALGTPASGVMTNVTGTAASLTAGNATLAATSTVVDAAAASTTYYPVLVDGLTGAQALEAESELSFVGNTGILTATGFAGALTGNVTGNATGSSGSCTGNALTATTLATARNIAGQSFDGSAAITIASTDLSNTSAICLLTATQTLTNKTIAGGTFA
nr:hypothetical protein [uncultured Mediterranean phage uvMED]